MNLLEKKNTCDAIANFLETIGIEYAFGIVGGPIAHFITTLTKSQVKVLHFKHETGAAFAAIEASLASNKPVVLFVTTGPGITNALTGIISARSEGAKVIVISGYTSPAQRGRYVSQDTSPDSFSQNIFATNSIFDFSTVIDHAEDLERAFVCIEQGCQKPAGFVGHIGLPANMQTTVLKNSKVYEKIRTTLPPECSVSQIRRCLDILAGSPFVIWAGFGARHAWQEVRTLVEVTNAKLMCTPRAKGILPDNHPNFIGMTGLGCEPEIESYFASHSVENVLVLGSRLGEASSFWSENFMPRKSLIHVDINPRAILAAYRHIETLGVQSEIKAFITGFLKEWKELGLNSMDIAKPKPVINRFTEGRHAPVRPSFLMQAVQKEIIEKTDAIILVDVGNSFSFSNRYLNFSDPHRYRVHFDFGSMGCASAGVLGAALGSGRKAVAIVGDGAMLMLNEINTAARYNIDCLWIVLNDARYGMVAQGLEAMHGTSGETDFPRCNFATIAHAMGANGIQVETETALSLAFQDALLRPGPFLIDVNIDRSEKAPSGQRFVSLSRQGEAT